MPVVTSQSSLGGLPADDTPLPARQQSVGGRLPPSSSCGPHAELRGVGVLALPVLPRLVILAQRLLPLSYASPPSSVRYLADTVHEGLAVGESQHLIYPAGETAEPAEPSVGSLEPSVGSVEPSVGSVEPSVGSVGPSVESVEPAEPAEPEPEPAEPAESES